MLPVWLLVLGQAAASNCLGTRSPPACASQIGHAVLAEERGQQGEQTVDPTETVPFPDALLQVSWVVQASASGGSSAATLLRLCWDLNGPRSLAPARHVAWPAPLSAWLRLPRRRHETLTSASRPTRCRWYTAWR